MAVVKDRFWPVSACPDRQNSTRYSPFTHAAYGVARRSFTQNLRGLQVGYL